MNFDFATRINTALPHCGFVQRSNLRLPTFYDHVVEKIKKSWTYLQVGDADGERASAKVRAYISSVGGDQVTSITRWPSGKKYRNTVHFPSGSMSASYDGSRSIYKKLSYRRGTARCVVSIEILPIATRQCRNYLYDKSWPNRWYEVGDFVGGNAW